MNLLTNPSWLTMNNGLLGINTTTPAYTLDVTGTIRANAGSNSIRTSASYGTIALRVRGGDNAVIDSGVNGASGGWFQVGDGLTVSTAYPLLLQPIGGFVGIGTVSPLAPLHVSGSVNYTFGSVSSSGFFAGGGFAISALSGLNPTSIIASGWIVSQTGIAAVSDSRTKTNIKNLETNVCLNAVRDINPIEFIYKDVVKHQYRKHYGFMAQEIDNVFEGVGVLKDASYTKYL